MSLFTVLFLILAIVCWGAGAFLDKLTLKYLGAEDTFFARLVLMMVFFFPLIVWRWNPTKYAVAAAEKISIVLIASSIIVTMSGVYFYLKAMSGGEASKIVPLSSTYPLVAFLLAVIFLGESFTWIKLAGTAFVAIGIWLITL